MEHDLVDELRLMVFPVVLGTGERLFGETSDKMPMRLLDSQTIGDGLAFLTHELVRLGAWSRVRQARSVPTERASVGRPMDSGAVCDQYSTEDE